MVIQGRHWDLRQHGWCSQYNYCSIVDCCYSRRCLYEMTNSGRRHCQVVFLENMYCWKDIQFNSIYPSLFPVCIKTGRQYKVDHKNVIFEIAHSAVIHLSISSLGELHNALARLHTQRKQQQDQSEQKPMWVYGLHVCYTKNNEFIRGCRLLQVTW